MGFVDRNIANRKRPAESLYDKTTWDFLSQADTDFSTQGYTEKTCPVCGNSMTKIGTGNAYTIQCVTYGCIKGRYGVL